MTSTRTEPRRRSVVRQVVLTVLGGALLLLGVALLVLPGPGALVIVAGLAVLAGEYDWARRWLGTARSKAESSAATSASSPLSLLVTGLGVVLLLGAAVLCFTGVTLGIPLVATLTSPLTGVVLVVSALLVIGLTGWERRKLVRGARHGDRPLAEG